MKSTRYLWPVALILLLVGCATQSGILGGGKPTTVKCKGKMAISGGPYALLMDCPPEGAEFSINVQ